jgi:hypothetical protein
LWCGNTGNLYPDLKYKRKEYATGL